MDFKTYSLSISNSKFAKSIDLVTWKNNVAASQIFIEIFEKLRRFNREKTNIVYNILQRSKGNDLSKLIDILLLIIPIEYFGNKGNCTEFARICKKIMSCTTYECMYEKELYENFDRNAMKWLENEENQELILLKANKWVLDFVFKPTIRSHFKSIHFGDHLKLVKRSLWQSVSQKIINKLVSRGTMKRVQNIPSREIIGHLKILPEEPFCDCNFKMRTTFVNGNKMSLKPISRTLTDYSRLISKYNFNGVLYDKWTRFVKINSGKEIFAAKVDLKDAYGNVNTELVLTHLKDAKSSLISTTVYNTVRKFITKQYVSLGKQVFLWQKGIVKGHPLSASVCELYLTLMDNQLEVENDKNNCLLIRKADDYMYCSTARENVRKFISEMKLKRTINNLKTETNVDSVDVQNIKYCGYLIHLNTKEISLFYYDAPTEIRHRYKFMSPDKVIRPQNLLMNTMKLIANSFTFNKTTLNLCYNKSSTFQKNFFDGMIHLAFKFSEVFACIKRIKMKDRKSILTRIINETVRSYSKKAFHFALRYTDNVKPPSRKLLTFLGDTAFDKVFCRRFALEYNYPGISKAPLKYSQKIPVKFAAVRVGRSLRKTLIMK